MSPSSPTQADRFPAAMVSSTVDSGLILTIGIPKGDIAKPDGNPVILSTVPGSASTPAHGYARVEQDNPAVTYTGNWVATTSPTDYSGGSAAESVNAGDEFHYNFTGTAVRWVGYRGTDTGMADVYIDGLMVGSVDTYSTAPYPHAMLFTATGLTPGGHTLTVQVEGLHNSASTGSAVWVDALDVSGQPAATSASVMPESTGSTVTTRIQEDDPAISYSGSWSSESSGLLGLPPQYSGGSAAVSSSGGSQAILTFIGTGVSWIGYKDTLSGIADVILDGSPVATVDSYDTLPASQATLYSVSGLTNARHSLTIRVTGGHSLLSLGSNVTVDAFDVQAPPPDTTPPTVSMTAPVNGATVSKTITISATASDNVGVTSVQFELDGAALGGKLSSAPYSISWDSTAVANGSHTLAAVASDAAGNHSTATPVTVEVANQTQPPPDTTPPTVSMTAPVNGATVSGTVTVSADASDNVGVAGVQFLLDGAALGTEDTNAPYSVSWNTVNVPNGTHRLSAMARDASGNTSTSAAVTVTVSNGPPPDTTPPAVNMTAPANGATVSGNVTVSANASDNVGVAGVQFELDGAALGAEVTSAPYSISWNSTSVANGSHSLTAVARDAAGNHTTATPVNVTVSNQSQPPPDTTPPTVSMTAPANGATVSGNVTVSANASDNVGVVGVQFKLDGANLGPEDTSAPYSITWNSAGASNGSHSLTAVARDAAGNKTTATSVTVTVSNSSGDTTPPTVSITAPASGSTVTGTVTVSATASDNVGVAGVQFMLDGAALGAEDTTAPYSVSWNTTSASNGGHTLTAVARDAAGNHTTSSPVSVTVSNSGGGGTTTRIEQDNPAVAYTGTWVTASDSSVSGGTATESNQANATATLTFSGTGVTWIGYKCGCAAGIADVSVDGGAPTQVDNYSATTEPQAKVFSVSNLPKGTHTLKITVTGTFDRNGSTAYVVVDAFDVTD
ncbi:MAG: Ig-like domain-containing protein [Bacillota bacterium]